MSDSIYAENIIDHYKNPRNYGNIENPDIYSKEYNPLCGDEIEIHLKLENGIVKESRFHGIGCAISQASASMLMEYIEGKHVDEIKNITREDIKEMLGIQIGVVRIKCALLCLSTLHKGIMSKEDKNDTGN